MTAGDEGLAGRDGYSVEHLAVSGSVGYRLLGDLDASALPELRRLLRHDLTDGRNVVLELSSVAFMSSSVLAVLRGARRLAAAYGTSLRLLKPSAPCVRTLSIAGLEDAFIIDHVVDLESPAIGSVPPHGAEASASRTAP